MQELDLDSIASEVEDEQSIDYRDPFQDPYLEYTNSGEPRSTDSQIFAWKELHAGVHRQAMIASKGSGKTRYGAFWAFHFGQNHHGCSIAIVANTHKQARDAAGEHFMAVARVLGYQSEYFRSKKIKGQQHSQFYIVDLDGQGYQTGKNFFLFVRSLNNVSDMEGSEYDAMWFEEIQDASRDELQIAFGRNRGNGIASEEDRNPLYIAGMTRGELHWMYDMVEERMGFDTRDEYERGESDGLLLEPALFENRKNVGQGTIDDYLSSMDTRKAQQEVYAKRTSTGGNRVYHEYRDDLHRTGRMSRVLASYDPYKPLMLVIDFNVSPMSATVWQEKRWNDAWLDDDLLLRWTPDGRIEQVEKYVVDDDSVINPEQLEPSETYETLWDYERPNTDVLAQVDEFEIWPDGESGTRSEYDPRWTGKGGTEGLIRAFIKEYKNHHREQILITGDATGRSRRSNSMVTDWQIIRRQVNRKMNDVDTIVKPGVIVNGGLDKDVTYENPLEEDRINLVNATLMNAQGEARMCFLPESRYESGGAAASISMLRRKENGDVDDSVDKQSGKEVARTHFSDTVGYAVWEFQDGMSTTAEEFDDMLDEVEETESGFTPAGENGWGEDEPGFGESEPNGSEWMF